MIVLYNSKETDFTHNGICVLDNIIKYCKITEVLNGEYFLDIEVIKDEQEKYKNITEFCIIKADDQLFRLYNKTNLQDKGLYVRAELYHISSDIDTDFIEDNRAENTTVDIALKKVVVDPRFTVVATDITNTNTAYFVKDKPVSSIFKTIIPRWGGELYRDNFNIGLFSRVGSDTGLSIEYAKNIIGFEQNLDYTQMITRMMPTGKDGIDISLFNNGSKWLTSPRVNEYFKIFSNEIKFSNIEDSSQLKTTAESLWGTIDLPKINYKINFMQLERTEQYKNIPAYAQLHGLKIGDSVIIKHKIFNVNLTARVIKIVKDVLTGKLLEIELGEFRDNILKSFNTINSKVENVSEDLSNTKVAIQETVNGLQIEVSGKIDEEDCKSIISQSPDEIRLGLNNTHYSFTEDSFNIGSNVNGDVAEHTPVYSKWKHSDGSYSKISADGIQRHVGTTDKNYHYLMKAGEGTTYPNDDRFVTVQLPEEFKGKNFEISVSMQRIIPNATNNLIKYFECSLYSKDVANGRFTVYGSCDYTTTTNVTGLTSKGWIDFAYVAIA
jgi:phage minor structural protein